jgi:hypothetical protein
MRVEFYAPDEFVVAQCTFEERLIPREAGFLWVPARKRWITTDDSVAIRIPQRFLAASAKRALGLAVDSLLIPEGLDYLPFQEDGIRFALERKDTLIADQPGLGKGHPLSTRVLTPAGWTAIGALALGSTVIGSDGKPTRVTGVFDRGMMPVYRVSFSDGASVVTDGDHLWQLTDLRTVETREMGAMVIRKERIAIPWMSAPAELYPMDLPMPPAVAAIDMATDGGKVRGVTINPVYTDIFDNRPDLFARGSKAQRLAYLRGFVRTIGRVVDEDEHLRISLVGSVRNSQVAASVVECVRSLGGMAVTARKPRRLLVDFWLPPEIRLVILGLDKESERKKPKKRLRKAKFDLPLREVVDVRPAGQDLVRCISVSAPDQLYVVEEYIVTHNTIQAMGVFNSLPSARRGLIVCPASLKGNWFKEFEKWDVHGRSVDVADGKYFPTSDYVIINYDILHKHEEVLKTRVWDAGAFDESHALKNHDSRRTRQALGGRMRVKPEKGPYKTVTIDPLPIRRRLFLSGTPLANKPIDLFTTAQACDPYGFGVGKDNLSAFETFAYRYNGAYTDSMGNLTMGEPRNLSELNERMKATFMIRRLKADVLKDLPPKVRQIIPLSSEGLKAKVNAEKDSLLAMLDTYEQMMGIQKNMSTAELLEAVLRVHPSTWEKYAEINDSDGAIDMPLTRLANARQELAIAKLPMVLEYVGNLLADDEKVVVFGYHQAVIEGLLEKFPDACCIYGKTPKHKRTAQQERFQTDPEARVFIGQYTAAGTGFTLTAARHVVFAELTWVPHELLQAEDRIHRISQLAVAHAHHLVVQGSLDDTFVARLIAKMAAIEEALD